MSLTAVTSLIDLQITFLQEMRCILANNCLLPASSRDEASSKEPLDIQSTTAMLPRMRAESDTPFKSPRQKSYVDNDSRTGSGIASQPSSRGYTGALTANIPKVPIAVSAAEAKKSGDRSRLANRVHQATRERQLTLNTLLRMQSQLA